MIDFNALEKSLGLEGGTLSTANESDETIQVDLNGSKVFSSADYDTLINNHATELESKQVYSKQVGYEEALKKVVRGVLPEGFEGRKDIDKVISGIKTQKFDESGFNPDKAFLDLQTENAEYKGAISKQKDELDSQKELFNTTVSGYKDKENKTTINSALRKEFAGLEGKSSLSEKDALALYSLRRSIKVEEGNIRLYDGESQLKNDILEPVSLDTDFGAFMSEYIKSPTGGKGDKLAEPTGATMTTDKWSAAFDKSYPNAPQSEKMVALNEAIGKGTVTIN